jgi:DNA-binding CsgD family transcriptional regulator
MDEALALERSMPDWALTAPATNSLVHQLVWSGELDRARHLIAEWRAGLAGLEHHEESRALWFQAVLEWRAGNWEVASRLAAACLTIRAQFSRLGGQPISEFPAAGIAAHLGQLDEARARSLRALAEAEREGFKVALSGHSWILGFIELSRGDVAAALPLLERSRAIREEILLLEPGQQWELGDLLEALISVGRLDEAEARLGPWEEHAAVLDRSWALAIAARCRALLLAARGDLVAAHASFGRALAEHARTQDPFQHARTLMAAGIVLRRARQRAAARASLEDALAIFGRLGAGPWAERARAELGRIGGRVRSSDELTEGERQIAALVAQGRTNREVAAALFVTEHTVEAALTRVYRKLEVRSRSELAARLGGESLGEDAPNL